MAIEITPRAALRTINDHQNSLEAVGKPDRVTNKPGYVPPVNSLFKKDREIINAKKQMRVHTDPTPELKVKTKEKVVTTAPERFEEKEFMYIYDPEEDLKPKVDKALVGLAERICNWRPPCLFGVGKPESMYRDDDDNYVSPEEDEDDILPPMEDAYIYGEEDLSDVLATSFNIDDIPVPDIEDLPIPYIDETDFMGRLKILDTSAHESLSP